MADRAPNPYEFLPEKPSFELTSDDVSAKDTMPEAHVFDGFGLTGGNTSPHLSWSGAPEDTAGYVVSVFDPDAPTGSGFSHWRAWDIPATAAGFGGTATPPAGTVVGQNDFGHASFDGPCPPAGDIVHHYQIRVLALGTASIGLPSAGTSTALSGFALGQNVVGVARMTVTARS